MYVLVKENRVIVGPKEWHPTLFQAFIDNAGIAITVPSEAPVTNTDIGGGIKVYTVVSTEPTYNSKIQKLDGPYYVYTDIATQSYTAIPKGLDEVKGELKGQVANNRYKVEISGTTATIQSNVVNVSTARADRSLFSQIVPASVVKFGSAAGTVFITVTAQDLIDLASALNSFVQASFAWEYTKDAEIQAATTLDALNVVTLEMPGFETPVHTPGIL